MGGSPPAPKPFIPPDPVDPEKEAAKAREETIQRRRRGLAGLITTSLLGLSDETPAAAGRKSLLGE